jgi:hypothetical protein
MNDLSIFGTVATVTASNTFPAAALITHFADDADGMDLPEQTIAAMEMGVNGDAVSWSVAAPIQLTMNLIPNTLSHVTMGTIYEANRPEKGKRPARDVITVVRIAPDGSTLTLSGGKIISGTPATSMASSGRLKTASYQLSFAKMLYTPSPDALQNI